MIWHSLKSLQSCWSCSFSGLCWTVALPGVVFLQTLYAGVVKCILDRPHCVDMEGKSLLKCCYCTVPYVKILGLLPKRRDWKGNETFYRPSIKKSILASAVAMGPR